MFAALAAAAVAITSTVEAFVAGVTTAVTVYGISKTSKKVK